MNLTKAQTLDRIAALTIELGILSKHIKELEKPTPFKTGDVFAWQTKNGEKAAVFATDHTETSFRLTGAHGNLAHPFRNEVMNREEMEQYLSDTRYVKIGKLGVILDIDYGIYLD